MDDKNVLGAQGAAEDVSAGSIARDAASHAAPTHTPGPWKWTDCHDRGGWVSGVLRGKFFDKDYVYPIINTPGVIDGLCVEVDQANAHLISAAPELLEACKQALTWRALDGDGISDPTRSVLISAIAKAERRTS